MSIVCVFPAHAGMSQLLDQAALHAVVFPAHAGMSLTRFSCGARRVSFPRSRGDEPVLTPAALFPQWFSPLTRG